MIEGLMGGGISKKDPGVSDADVYASEEDYLPPFPCLPFHGVVRAVLVALVHSTHDGVVLYNRWRNRHVDDHMGAVLLCAVWSRLLDEQ